MGARRLEDAAIQYRKALQKDPVFGEAYYRLGMLEFERKNPLEAYQLLSRAVELAPTNEDAKIRLADISLTIYVAAPVHPRLQYEQVVKLADQLLSKDPNSFDGLRLKGAILLLDRKSGEAVGYLEKANRIKPMQPDVSLSLTQALFQENRTQEAEALALGLIQEDKSFPDIYDVLYRYYLGRGLPADAEKVLRMKVDNNPTNADYVFQLAQYYMRQGKQAEAAQAVQRLLNNSKTFPDARLQVGDFYSAMGNPVEAARQYQEGLRSDRKQKPIYRQRLARAMLAQGNIVEGARLVEELLKERPKDEEFRALRANLLMSNGRSEDLNTAVAEFDELVKERPENAIYRYDLGRAYQLKGDLNAAKAQFQGAIQKRGDFLPSRAALALISLQQRQPESAIRYTSEILAYDPRNYQARLLHSVSLIATERYHEAHTELDRLLADYPRNKDIQLQFGFLAIAQKKYKDAEQIFGKLYQPGDQDTRAAAGLAETYSAESQFDKTLQFLTDQLKRSPGSSELRQLLANVAARAARYDVAIAEYQTLLSQNPKSAQLYFREGELYIQKEDFAHSISALQRAEEIMPNDANVIVLLAYSLAKTGQVDQAKASYRRALQLKPDDPMVLNELAFLLAEKDIDLDEALKYVQRALQILPREAAFADTLGWIYLKKGMKDSSLQTFSVLVRQYPQNPVYRYHLGMALLEKGDRAKAKTEFENALANRPSHEDELKVKELLSRL